MGEENQTRTHPHLQLKRGSLLLAWYGVIDWAPLSWCRTECNPIRVLFLAHDALVWLGRSLAEDVDVITSYPSAFYFFCLLLHHIHCTRIYGKPGQNERQLQTHFPRLTAGHWFISHFPFLSRRRSRPVTSDTLRFQLYRLAIDADL